MLEEPPKDTPKKPADNSRQSQFARINSNIKRTSVNPPEIEVDCEKSEGGGFEEEVVRVRTPYLGMVGKASIKIIKPPADTTSPSK